MIAIASPVLGAIADASGRRKPWIFAFTALGVAGCFGLRTAWPDPSAVIHSLILFGIANIAFEIAIVFYNAMLPELVADEPPSSSRSR